MNDELFTQTAPTNLLELTTPKSKSSKSNKRKINNDDDDSSNSTTIDQQTYDKSLDLLKDSSVYLQRPQKKWRYTLQTSSASQPLLQNPLLSAEPEFLQLQQQIESIQDRYTKALESRQELREQTERETQLERERETVHLHENSTSVVGENCVGTETCAQRQMHRTGLFEQTSLSQLWSLSHTLQCSTLSTETSGNREQLANNVLGRKKTRVDFNLHHSALFTNNFNGNDLFGERLRRTFVCSKSLQASLSSRKPSFEKTKDSVG